MVAATDKNIQDVHQSINAQEDTVNQKGNETKDVNIKVDAEPPVKRKRGRPPKLNKKPKPVVDPSLPKRKRGRPKKVVA